MATWFSAQSLLQKRIFGKLDKTYAKSDINLACLDIKAGINSLANFCLMNCTESEVLH